MTVGTRLRALRNAKGLTLREVGRLSGVPFATLCRAEKDIGKPENFTLRTLSDFYGVSLVGLTDAYEPTHEETEAFLLGHGHNLEALKKEFNALIDKLQATATAILAERKADER